MWLNPRRKYNAMKFLNGETKYVCKFFKKRIIQFANRKKVLQYKKNIAKSRSFNKAFSFVAYVIKPKCLVI